MALSRHQGLRRNSQLPDETYSHSSPGWLLRQQYLEHVVSSLVLLLGLSTWARDHWYIACIIVYTVETSQHWLLATICISNHIIRLLHRQQKRRSSWLSQPLVGKWCRTDQLTKWLVVNTKCASFRIKSLRVGLKMVWLSINHHWSASIQPSSWKEG